MKFTILGLCCFQRILRRHTVLTEIVFCIFVYTWDIHRFQQHYLSTCSILAKTFKVSRIRNYLHIIGLSHRELGLENPLADNWVLDILLKDMKCAKGDAVQQKLPITADLLLKFEFLV